jgi:diguanylate cyclase (GGDEF)-like protein/PAS domain S-box-containing protein
MKKSLRSEAEQHLAQLPKADSSLHSNEELLQELRVHQIELEMQNEQLRKAQIELERSRDRYIDFYDFAPVGYFILNVNGLINEINLTAAALLGLERNKLTHHHFASLVTTEDGDRWHLFFRNVLKSDKTQTCELTLRRADRPHLYVRLDCLSLINNGTVAKVSVVLTDITERKFAENKLTASEQRFRRLVENSPLCIHEIDLEGRLQSMNKAGLDMLGLDEEKKICGVPYLSASSEQDNERIKALMQDAFNGAPSHFEFAGAGDTPLYFKSCFIPIYNNDGKVIELMGLTEDITERKRIEYELREKEERIALATLYNGVGIWDWNLVTQQMIWDDSMYALYHIKREDFIVTEEAWRASLHPDDLERGDREVEAAIRGEKPFDTEFRVVWPDGDIRHIKAVAKVFRDEQGTPLRMLGTNVDITLLRVADAERDRLLRIIEDAPDFICMADMQGNLLFQNTAANVMLGLPDDADLSAMKIKDMHPAWAAKLVLDEGFSTMLRQGFWQGENAVLHRNGHETPVSQTLRLHRDDSGNPQFISTIIRDITKRKLAEKELRIAATAFEAQEGIAVTDAEGEIIRVNKAFTEITGYTNGEVIGKNPHMFQSGRHDKNFYQAMWERITSTGAWEGEIWNRRKSGEVYPEHLTITAVKDSQGIVSNYVATLTDITLAKAAVEEIKHLAFYDPLTSLPNRRLFMDRLQQSLASSKRSGRKGAMMFIDLDKFKTLNDTLGHDKGDLLLQQVAQRLESCVREGDTVARLGGDEFVVILEDLSENAIEALSQTEAVGNKILATLNQPYQLAEHEYLSSSSIGASIFNEKQQTIEELMKQADLAMYESKKAGRNTMRFFDPQKGAPECPV